MDYICKRGAGSGEKGAIASLPFSNLPPALFKKEKYSWRDTEAFGKIFPNNHRNSTFRID